ncbi:MAG: 50S ribosomal protein L18 [bacterium]|nr:50S ribosomal protein L18 [bacterium]
MNSRKTINKKRARRVARNKARIFGTAERPRLAVKRSNRSIHAQIIDDGGSKTLAHASSREVEKSGKKLAKIEQSALVGELLAKRALGAGIKKSVLDRRHYKYHGRVRALVEGARKAGLTI